MSEQYGSIFEMLDNRLSNIEESTNSIKTDIAVVKERQCAVIADISGVKTTIYGNGQPGLVTKVALIWQKVALISVLIGFVASAIVSIAISVIKG